MGQFFILACRLLKRTTLKMPENRFAFVFFVFTLLLLAIYTGVLASDTNGTIDSTNKYAWSNYGGWVNFGATNGDVSLSDSGITGYAWNENYGWINMSPTNSGVSVSASGALSGSAWGQNTGWIDFSGTSISCSGEFTGTAVGNTIGTITFDCTNCNVTTDYRPSSCRTSVPPPGGGSHLICDNGTHKCVTASWGGSNECETAGEYCCDPHGDLDFDKAIGYKDLSIMAHYWSNSPPSYKCPDINEGGKVWYEDLSIMAHYWSEFR
jgi:uncharacterized membrane protein